MPDPKSPDPRRATSALPEEILRYLEHHPRAADTAAGVARFWLAGQPDVAQVEAALSSLEAAGKIRRWRVVPDGGWIYGRRKPETAP